MFDLNIVAMKEVKKMNPEWRETVYTISDGDDWVEVNSIKNNRLLTSVEIDVCEDEEIRGIRIPVMEARKLAAYILEVTKMRKEITGELASELLRDATQEPWEWYWDYGLVSLKGSSGEPIATDLNMRDSDLIASAPELAKTIKWLYGMEPGDNGVYSAGYDTVWALNGNVYRDHKEMEPDEAIALARALLAAAEQAKKDGQDKS